MITNCKKNIMGTISFDGKFAGMRKEQDFIVYPKGIDDIDDIYMIQSNTRIGRINMVNGDYVMSQPHSSGAYGVHLAMDKLVKGTLDNDDLVPLRNAIKGTAGAMVGRSIVHCDNTGAMFL